MSKLPIAGGRKFVPHSEPNERFPVTQVPVTRSPLTPQSSSDSFIKSDDDIRANISIPGPGQSTHDGWSGFIPEEKFSNQGSLAYDGSDLDWETRSGMQGKNKVGTSKPVNEPKK
jgi:hypothetical protein